MRPTITVVGLGPAGEEFITAATRNAVAAHRVCFVRTRRHPSAQIVGDATSFDYLYHEHEAFDRVYASIVEQLVASATEHGEVLYAVPGSPMVAEHTVELLLRETRVDVVLVPALSFLDLTWVRLGVDPLAVGVRIVDAHRFAAEAAGERGPLLVAQCHDRSVLSDVKLALDDTTGDGPPVTILHHLGLPDEQIVSVPWAELDHFVGADHLTSLWIPRLAEPIAAELVGLVELVRTLREQCPWDAQQTHSSLRRYVVEEAYELVDAIDADSACGSSGADDIDLDVDLDVAAAAEQHLIDELGDVLFQVVFHATLGEEAGRFTLADVARTLHEKLVHRHPHVFPRDDFAAGVINSPNDVVANWERIKRDEKSSSGGIADGLPALLYAAKVLKRTDHAVVADPTIADEAQLGQRLLELVATARVLGVDAEVALRSVAARLHTLRADHLPEPG